MAFTTDFAFQTVYDGVITGTLNQCPKTYTIQVKATDSVTPPVSPTSFDTEFFNIQVNKSILINGRDSITSWDNPNQLEPYTASQYFGTPIGWVLDPPVSGFTVGSTGSDSAVILRAGAISPGTYTLNLKATDPACFTTGPVYTNTLTKPITVTVSAAGAALPIRETAMAWWRFDSCLWNGTTGEVINTNALPSPNSLHGTAVNGAFTIPDAIKNPTYPNDGGRTCRGGYFDGNNDQVSVPDNNLLDFPNPATFSPAWASSSWAMRSAARPTN